MNAEPPSTVDMLNGLLGVYYTALAQHQTHVALLDSWGLVGLAHGMEARIADEPVTIGELMQRLLDLGGTPNFAPTKPNIGASVGDVLDKDLEIQRLAPAGLNAGCRGSSRRSRCNDSRDARRNPCRRREAPRVARIGASSPQQARRTALLREPNG